MNGNIEPQLLSMDLNTVETSLPVLKPGTYECRIAVSEIEQPTDPAKAASWHLRLETVGPATDVDGKPVDPGHPFFTQCQLAPTGKATMKMVVQNIAQVVQALRPRIDGQITLPIDPWHKMVEGKVVRVEVESLPRRENPKAPGSFFNATNRVARFYKN